MSLTATGGDPALRRLEQAALWLQRMRDPGQDPRVVEDWLQWCQRDPLNQQAYDEIAAIWELSGPLDDAAPAARAAQAPERPRRGLLAAAVAVFGVALAAGGWWLARGAGEEALLSRMQSPIGSNTSSTLADGSVLELGGGTLVSVSIGPRERRIELHEGELYITVQKDPSRPFMVNSGRLKVLATGTEFNVRRTPRRTTVTLAEGAIETLYEGQAPGTPNTTLVPGQQLLYTHGSQQVRVQQTELHNIGAWREGLLSFGGEPLSEVLESLNRYASSRIVIEDARIGALSYTGTARTDNIAGWLAGVQHSFPVVVEELADGRQRIGPRTGALAE